MREFIPAFLLIVCGAAGLTLLQWKGDYTLTPLDGRVLNTTTIAIKTISGDQYEEEGGIRILDISDISITADSLQ